MKSISIVFCVVAAVNLCAMDTWAQSTWTGGGGDNRWSTADNWGGTAPTAGSALVFAGTAQCTNVNDFAPDTAFAGLTFSSGSGLFSLSGNRVALGGNIVNNDSHSHLLNFDQQLGATRTFTTTSTGGLFLNGVLSGAGGVTVGGSSAVVLSGANVYTGATTVASGTLRIQNGSALGTVDGGVSIGNGGRLELSDNVVVTGEVATINGNGGNNNGALQSYSGSNTWAGKIAIGSSDARIGVGSSQGTLVVSGPVDDGGAGYNLGLRNLDNNSVLVMSGASTYKGETKLVVGNVKLSGGDNRLPTNSVLRLGNASNIGTVVFDLNGQNQTFGGLTQDGTTMAMSITNSAAGMSTLTVNTFGSTAYTCTVPLFGGINLVKVGTNVLTLANGINTITGTTSVCEGRLVMGGPWVLQDSTVNAGNGVMGILSFGTNTTVNFGGLTGTNDVALTNASGVAVTLRIRGAQTCVYDGHLVGGCDFVKTGSGSFTMKNAGSYTGRTSLVNGKLIVPSEDVLGVAPVAFVQNQISLEGGTLRSLPGSNFVLGAGTRGVTLTSGGTLEIPDYTNTFTVAKPMTGSGWLAKRGSGVLLLACSNAYDGVTSAAEGVLRIAHNAALGSAVGGTAVATGAQLELAAGVVVSNESLSINGAGMTVGNAPPSAPQFNRGALQTGTNATAEWAGPVLLTPGECRIGAQDGGQLIVSGVIGDAGSNLVLHTSSNPVDRQRGTVLKGANTYSGITGITRGTLFMGAANSLPAASVLDVHWSNANNTEYAALDLCGFDQTVGGLQNSGFSGNFAVVTNSSATLATLVVNQTSTTVFSGLLAGKFALVKSGAGSLSLTNRNVYSGTTTVSGGTLRLGVNGAIPGAGNVVLSGGTLDVSGTTNSVASLTVSADSTLSLGTGTLAVSAQSSDAWTGSLTVTGTLGATSLRFQPALSASQLAAIRNGGKRVMQNADGYITPWYGTIVLVN